MNLRLLTGFLTSTIFSLCAVMIVHQKVNQGSVLHVGRVTASVPSDGLIPGTFTRSIMVESRTRRYVVHVPTTYLKSRPTPVVIAYHGGGGNPESMIRLSGLSGKSEEAGFVVVYPYGSGVNPDRNLSFNGGECCAYAMTQNIDDIAFTRTILEDLAGVMNVDPDRVFATGLSNGGIMAHYAASKLPGRIAAIAPVGGPLMIPSVRTTRAVPVMHFHGTADQFAPFSGGYGTTPTGSQGTTLFRSVKHTTDAWIKNNECAPNPKVTALPDLANDGMTSVQKTWRGGRNGSEVVLIEINGGGHTWPGEAPLVPFLGPSTQDFAANDLMWEFFQKHPRRAR